MLLHSSPAHAKAGRDCAVGVSVGDQSQYQHLTSRELLRLGVPVLGVAVEVTEWSGQQAQ